jgi:enoyl-CoA hydratase
MIQRTLSDGILTLQLAHGKANALDTELLEALLLELEGAREDVRALILTGSGSIFSAGVDLIRLTNEGAPYVRRFLPLLSRFVRVLFGLPKPVVAAVNGHAIAGGCIIALASDVRLMAEGIGRIGIPELLVGVPFPAAPLEVARFAIGRDRVQSAVYRGPTMLPVEALDAGFLDEVVESPDLMARAEDVARHLAGISPEAFRLTKLYLRAEALERMEKNVLHDEVALELWASDRTHQQIKDYLRRTLGK